VLVGESPDDHALTDAVGTADFHHIPDCDVAVGSGRLTVEVDLAAFAGAFGLRTGFTQTGNVEPDVDSHAAPYYGSMARRTVRWLAILGVAALPIFVATGACSPAPAVGDLADLGFILKDVDGNDVRLSDYRGRPLIVNFWFTTCPPCREETPVFIKLVDKYKDKGFTVLGLSISDTPAQIRAFAEEFGINYPLFVADGRQDILDAYRAIVAYPVSWFVRPDGTVYLKHLGTASPEWFEQQVMGLLESSGL
jgi:peroxiredoxin